GLLGRLEGLPEDALQDIVPDVAHAGVAQLGIAQPRDGVVLVEALLRLGGRLDVPLEEGFPERAGDLLREHRLPRPGLALHEEGPLERDRRVHRELELVARDVGVGAPEFHGASIPGANPFAPALRSMQGLPSRGMPCPRSVRSPPPSPPPCPPWPSPAAPSPSTRAPRPARSTREASP